MPFRPSAPSGRKKKQKQRESPPLPTASTQMQQQAPRRGHGPGKRTRAPQPPARTSPPEIQTGLPPQERGRSHARGRFAPPAFLAPPRGTRDPNVSFPGGATHGEHWTSAPFHEWLNRRFFDPDPQDEIRVLGLRGASELTKSRARFKNLVYNMNAQRIGPSTGPHHLSDEEIAKLYTGTAGLEPDLAKAAKGYGDIHNVPIPVPTLGSAGPGLGPLHLLNYPTGAKIGHIRSLGPSWLETPEAAQWAATGHTQHPWLTGIEIATLAPFGRPIRGARALGTALGVLGRGGEYASKVEARLAPEETRLLALARQNIAAGRDITPGQRAVLNKVETRIGRAREVYHGALEGPSVPGMVYRGKDKYRERVFQAGDLKVAIPAARSHIGRAIENLADVLRRNVVGGHLGIKTEQERALEELTRGQLKLNRIPEAKIRRLEQIGKHLSDDQEYAIRLELEQSPPEVAIAHHEALMNAAQNDQQAIFHSMHADFIRRAEKYLNVSPEGKVTLKADLPKYMQEARDLILDVTKGRENTYREMGLLSGESIARRIAGPNRVRRGARFQDAETALRQALQDSPIRAEIQAAAEQTAAAMTDIPERQRIAVDAMMNLWEANVRVAAERAFGHQQEFQQVLDYIRGVEVPATHVPEGALTQVPAEQQGMYDAATVDLAFGNQTPEEVAAKYGLDPQELTQYAADHGEQLTGRILSNKEWWPGGKDAGTTLFQKSDISPLGGDRGFSVEEAAREIGWQAAVDAQFSPFYAPLYRVLDELPPKFGTQELMGRLKKAGIKDEEIHYSGLNDFLKTVDKSTTSEEVRAFLDKNYLQLEENLRFRSAAEDRAQGANPYDGAANDDGVKFATYTVAGAENATNKELTISLPPDVYGEKFSYTSHFPEHNILVHARFSEMPVNGKRGLFIEEIQSDWHQQAQKGGYSTPVEENPEYQQALQRKRDAQAQVETYQQSIRRGENIFWPDVGIEKALNLNLEDAGSIRVFQHDLEKIQEIRGWPDNKGLEIMPTGWGDGVEVGGRLPGELLPGGEGVWKQFTTPFYDHDYEGIGNAAASSARERATADAQIALTHWNELLKMREVDFNDLHQKVEALRGFLATRSVEDDAFRDVSYRLTSRGVPDAPFKKTWHELGFKRMLAWAVDHGYEKLAWTTGAQQAERYDLANFFSKIEVLPGEPSNPVGSEDYYRQMEDAWGNHEGDYGEHYPTEPMPEDFTAEEYGSEQAASEAYDNAYAEFETALEEADQEIRNDFEVQFQNEWEQQYTSDSDYYTLHAWKKDSDPNGPADHTEEDISDYALSDYIGQDYADRVANGEYSFTGDELAIGSNPESARGAQMFYDKKLKGFAEKYLKKFGVEVKQERLGHRQTIQKWAVYKDGRLHSVEDTRDHAAGYAEALNAFQVENKIEANRSIFDVRPHVEEIWHGGPSGVRFYVKEKPMVSVAPRVDHFVVMRREADGSERQIGPSYSSQDGENARAQAEAHAQEARDMTPTHITGQHYGETVWSVDLPTVRTPSWKDFSEYKASMGEKVKRHDMGALREFQSWSQQQHPLSKFIAEGQPLFQRGGALAGISPFGVKGFVHYAGNAHAVKAVLGFTEHADISTFVHEIFGHWSPQFLPDRDYRSLSKWAGGNFDPQRGEVNVKAAERVAEAMEQYVREGRGPTPVKQAVGSLAPYFIHLYDGADLPSLSPQVRKIFERMFGFERLKGGKLLGAEDFEGVGLARVPTLQGVPLPSGIRGARARVASMAQYILSRGQVVGKGATDKSLHNEYTGAALLSGYFTADTVRPVARDAYLAVRLATVHRVRESLIEASFELPGSYTDIAVKVNPDETTPKSVATMLDKMRDIDRKGGKLSKADLDKIDFDTLEEAGRDIFPNQLLGVNGESKDIREVAHEILNTQVPIDNIRWIPRDWMDASGLMPPASRASHMMAGMKGSKGLIAVDAFNDLQKVMVLYLNPSYIPVNLVGNLVMNTMHQGVFTPMNLWRSAMMHQWLDGWERKMIDNQMGNGLTASLALRTGPGQLVHSTLGFWINQAVDLVPRRAAFLHEARRAGFKSKESVRDLIRRADAGDEQAGQDMKKIALAANDAIVDYERMSPLEREITSRLIFFYPWLKGATRYSYRFALEHPVQATALMLAAEHAYVQQQSQLGATPYYEGTDVPIATESAGLRVGIPGIYKGPEIGNLSQVFGDGKWVRGGLPMVIDARQFLTFTTPLDIYRAAYAFTVGGFTGDWKNSPAIVDNLTPFVGSSLVALQGYDPFLHKEVPRTLTTFFKQMQSVPQVTKWKLLTMSPEERKRYMENSINPRTREEAFWYVFGSGMAPTRYNEKVAAKRLLSDAPTKVRHHTELEQGAQKYGLGDVSDQILKQSDEYDSFNHDVFTGMKGDEKLAVARKYLSKHMDVPGAEILMTHQPVNQAQAEGLYEAIRLRLRYFAWRDYTLLHKHIDARDKRAAAREKVPSG